VTVFRKAAFSLLISVVLFAAVTVLAYTGLFNLIETRFYNPSIIKLLTRETAATAEVIRYWLADTQRRFSDSLDEPPVRRSFLPEQDDEDVRGRSRIYEALRESAQGLQSVRFVHPAGRRILFSTYAPDILTKNGPSISYRDYHDDPLNLPFGDVQVSEAEKVRLIFDGVRDRIIFSFPFYDSMNTCRGVALFTVSSRNLAERLIGEGRIKPGEDITVIGDPPGVISGGPAPPGAGIAAAVSSIWREGQTGLAHIDSVSGTSLALISAETGEDVLYGRLINEAIFLFPPSMKALLLLSVFCTIYLVLFFLLNLKQDSMLIIQNRLRELQISLIEQFYGRKSEIDWSRWTIELEQRRVGVRAEIKRGIKFGDGGGFFNRGRGYLEEDADYLINKSWDELLALVNAQIKTGIDEEKLRRILKNLLQSLSDQQASSSKKPKARPSREMITPVEAALLTGTEVSREMMHPEEDEDEEEFLDFASGKPDEGPVVDFSAAEAEFFETGETAAEPERQPPRTGGLLAAAIRKRVEPPDSGGGVSGAKEKEGPEMAKKPGEAVEPEEFEEATELEELEELEEDDQPSESPGPAAHNIDKLASMIEFGPEPASGPEEDEDAAAVQARVEVVSPFSSMLSSLGETKNAGAELPPDTAIDEQDGVPRVNSGVRSPDEKTEEGLDPDFKNLVNEVAHR
jgi:hypothetical protein